MNDLGPGARTLVEAGRRALTPSEADRERVLDALRARLGDAAVLGEAGAAGSSAAAASSIWPVLATVAVGLGVAGGVLFYVTRASEERAAPPPAPPSASALPVVAPAPTVAPPAEESRASAPREAPPAPPPSASARRSSLAQEVALLSRAASDLQAGRAAEALKVLDEHQHRFAGGVLAEERRAARVQALCALGRRGEAEAELARLVRASPQSPQVARARAFCARGR